MWNESFLTIIVTVMLGFLNNIYRCSLFFKSKKVLPLLALPFVLYIPYNSNGQYQRTYYVNNTPGVLANFTSLQTAMQLKGNFFPYHSAMGSGKGIIFRVAIPLMLENNYTIDSFYLHGKSHPFILIKSGKKTWLEANYYIAVPTPAYSNNQILKRDPTTINITDSIIVNHLFYPSWISVKGRSGKNRFEISLYKEIMSDSKY